MIGHQQKIKIEGDVEHGFADSDTNRPIKIGGRARQTNPTAVFDTERVEAMYDDVGRQLMWPVQVRDLLTTAYASTATLAEVTLATAVAGAFLDLIQITAANKTGAAVTLDLRDVTTGNVVTTLNIAANASETISFSPPLPQGNIGNNWTIQNAGSGDISNTVVSVTALFARNV